MQHLPSDVHDLIKEGRHLEAAALAAKLAPSYDRLTLIGQIAVIIDDAFRTGHDAAACILLEEHLVSLDTIEKCAAPRDLDDAPLFLDDLLVMVTDDDRFFWSAQ